MTDLVMSFDAQKNAWDFANKIAKSSMIPVHFRNKPEDVFVCILSGGELGFSPLQSLNSICMIQGVPTLKVQTMLAIVRGKCKTAVIDIKQDLAKLEVIVTAKRDASDVPYEVMWNMDRAKTMGLDSKSNYKAQPLTMLKARALSDAIRTVFPDLIMGFYSEEEMRDQPPIVSNEEYRSMIDQDFPIPEHEAVSGSPEYRIQNGILRGKQLKDADPEELSDYYGKLQKRATSKELKRWEQDLMQSIGAYLQLLES